MCWGKASSRAAATCSVRLVCAFCGPALEMHFRLWRRSGCTDGRNRGMHFVDERPSPDTFAAARQPALHFLHHVHLSLVPKCILAAISVPVFGRLGVWTPATREDSDVPFVLPGAPKKWGPCCSRRGGRRHDPVPGILILRAWTGRACGHPAARPSILGRATESRLAARSRTLYVHNDSGLIVPWSYRGRSHISSLADRFLLRPAAVH